MITQEISHHGHCFSIVTEDWTDAREAAQAVRALRTWIESKGETETRVLHFCITARQEPTNTRLHLVELDEVDRAAAAARAAALPDYFEEQPLGRRVILRADEDTEA
jgi:hypothetical protein